MPCSAPASWTVSTRTPVVEEEEAAAAAAAAEGVNAAIETGTWIETAAVDGVDEAGGMTETGTGTGMAAGAAEAAGGAAEATGGAAAVDEAETTGTLTVTTAFSPWRNTKPGEGLEKRGARLNTTRFTAAGTKEEEETSETSEATHSWRTTKLWLDSCNANLIWS